MKTGKYVLWTTPKISLNFYSNLFVTFFKKLIKFLLSTDTELFFECFRKISFKIYIKSKIPKIIERKIHSMQRPSPAIALQLPLPHHPVRHGDNSSKCEWRMPHCTSFCHSTHHFTLPPLPHLAPIYFHCIFRYALVFWLSTLCCDFKDVSLQKCLYFYELLYLFTRAVPKVLPPVFLKIEKWW